MRKTGIGVLVTFLILGGLATGGCPAINLGSALGLQDWGRDLLSIPAAVIIGELIDEAQGTNQPIDRDQLYDDLYAQLSDEVQSQLVAGSSTSTTRGPEGPAGQDGQDGQDGQAGQDGQSGQDGQDGQDGEDGKDLFAVAMGCVAHDGTIVRGYGFNARKVDEQGENGIYAVALIGYQFPEGFDPNDLVVLITPDALASQEIVPYYDANVGYGFLVEFRDAWLQRLNTDFCFAVYDTSIDPYAQN